MKANLADLTTRAQTVRRHTVTPGTAGHVKNHLDGLRAQAATAGILPAFDKVLGEMFGDLYGAKGPPPLSVTSMGGAPTSAGAGGTKGGATLAFHGMRDPAQIQKAIAERVPEMRTPTAPPMDIATQFKPMSATAKRDALDSLKAELATLHVNGDGGARVTLLEKLERSGLPADRILDVLAQVNVGYERVDHATGKKPPGYQLVNWKHTRLELDRVIDAVDLAKLPPAQAEAALYASLLSDAVKAPSNFLVHNVHGAQAAVMVLSRLVPPPSLDMIEDVARATLEHQVGPPSFMANVAMKNALRGAGVDAAIIDSICAKVSKPTNPAKPDDIAYDDAGNAKINFSEGERAALEKIGILEWTVPSPTNGHFGASCAVIDGDSLVNYACPDGWAKLAAITGPDQPPFLQNPLFIDGLLQQIPGKASALASFHDAGAVVSGSSRKMYDDGLERTTNVLSGVMDQLKEWAKAQKDVPLTADGKIPYLDGALDYSNPAQVDFARKLRDQGVSLLRAAEGLGL